MARETVKRTIDGSVFEFYPLPPKVALRVLTRLARVVIEPLGALGDKIKAAGGGLKALMSEELPKDLLAQALKALAGRLDENEVVDTVETLLAFVHLKAPGDKGTREIKFETDFEGRTLLLLKVVGAALEVNFADFFGALGARAAAEDKTTDTTPA